MVLRHRHRLGRTPDRTSNQLNSRRINATQHLDAPRNTNDDLLPTPKPRFEHANPRSLLAWRRRETASFQRTLHHHERNRVFRRPRPLLQHGRLPTFPPQSSLPRQRPPLSHLHKRTIHPSTHTPQAASQREIFLSPVGALFIGEFEMETYRHGWAFGGIVFIDSYQDGRRRAGSMSWGGAANCFWLMDRGAGIALTFGTQVIPPGDKGVKEVITVVEKEVYAMAGVA